MYYKTILNVKLYLSIELMIRIKIFRNWFENYVNKLYEYLSVNNDFAQTYVKSGQHLKYSAFPRKSLKFLKIKYERKDPFNFVDLS